MRFDKSENLFPIKKDLIYLAHCGISPLYSGAASRAIALLNDQQHCGSMHFMEIYPEEMERLKTDLGQLLRTAPTNVAAVKNTSEALSMIANGYPLEAGDEIISFFHEYPANHYPWRLLERRGARLKLLSNRPARTDIPAELPGTWSMDELADLITPRTRLIAISHVQFTSGYAADLEALGRLCHERDIHLVVDAAQSLGCMPVYPEAWNISALASAGWKWLLGPVGIGLFYTSPAFRDVLDFVAIGAETMKQGTDYLDHRWNPHHTAKRFEYSTSPVTLVAALAACLHDLHLRYSPEAIFREIIRLQDVFLSRLDNPAAKPLLFPPEHRSGILSVFVPDLEACAKRLADQKLICTPRGGLLRIAPHFYNTDEDMERLAEVFNTQL